MSKKEKKVAIDNLFERIYNSNDVDEIASLSEQLIIEVYSSGFNFERLKMVAATVDNILKDALVSVVESIGQDRSNEVKLSIKEASDALSALIDLSSLPN
jgi:predicted regulator of amino acid metabolism with ACT domain